MDYIRFDRYLASGGKESGMPGGLVIAIVIAVLIAGYICTFLFASFFEKGIGPIPQFF